MSCTVHRHPDLLDSCKLRFTYPGDGVHGIATLDRNPNTFTQRTQTPGFWAFRLTQLIIFLDHTSSFFHRVWCMLLLVPFIKRSKGSTSGPFILSSAIM